MAEVTDLPRFRTRSDKIYDAQSSRHESDCYTLDYIWY